MDRHGTTRIRSAEQHRIDQEAWMAAQPDDSRVAVEEHRAAPVPAQPVGTSTLVLAFARPEAGQALLTDVLPFLRDAQGSPVGLAVTDAGCLVLGGRAPAVTDGAAHAVLLVDGDPTTVRERLPAGVQVLDEGPGSDLLERYASGLPAPRGPEPAVASGCDPDLNGLAADARRAAEGLQPASAVAAPRPEAATHASVRGHLGRRRGRDAAGASHA